MSNEEIIITLLTEIRDLLRSGSSGYQWTPEGLPVCPKHGDVMGKREKQGDVWYSHRVIDPTTGEEHYCRGYDSKNSPGWSVGEPAQPAPQPRETAVSQPTQPQPTPAELADSFFRVNDTVEVVGNTGRKRGVVTGFGKDAQGNPLIAVKVEKRVYRLAPEKLIPVALAS